MAADRLIILRRSLFVKSIATALRERCGVQRGDRLLVAVSGGADSVALLLALHALAAQRHWSLRLHVGHVNHHLRPEAAAEQQFVQQLAASLDLPFHHADIHPAEAPGNIEAMARHMRYAVLRDMANAAGATVVATAHHADDQLETMLMRLIRGASVHGLAGMAWRRRLGEGVSLIRPMLGVEHAAPIAMLREVEQPWCEDASNADQRWRARLRRDVLPVLKELRPSAPTSAGRTADGLREAAQLLRWRIARAARRHVHANGDAATMHRSTARRLPPLLLKGIVRRQARQMGAAGDALGAATLGPIIRAIRDDRGDQRLFHFSGGVTLTVTAEGVVWRR